MFVLEFLYVLKFSFVCIISFIYSSANFQNYILYFFLACKKKFPVLHCTVVFSLSYFNCTKFTRLYFDFLLFNINNSVKLLNNTGMAFIGI